MADIYKENIVDIDLAKGNLHREFLPISIGTSDDDADQFGMRVFRNGTEVDLSGCSCYGYFRDPQGNNIALTAYGTVDGNLAYVTLPPACYNYEGQFTLSIKLIGGGVTGTMRIIDGMVDNTNTGSAVAPTSAVPTYSEIISQYDAMVAATAAANGCTAETFVAANFYPEGKYVINSGALYRLTADHAANTTWANTSKVEVKFGNELSDVKSAIRIVDNKASAAADELLGIVSAEWESGLFGTSGYVNSTKWLRSKKISSGNYDIVVPSGYRYQIYYYVSDSSGTVQTSATTSNGSYSLTGTFVISAGKSNGATLTNDDIYAIESGLSITRKEDNTVYDLKGLEAETKTFIDYAEPLIEDISGIERKTATWADGIFGDNGYSTSNAWMRTQKFDPGKYSVSVPTGYRYQIYKYNSDSSGTQIIAATASAGTYVLADDFVISVSKTDGTALTFDEKTTLKRYTAIELVKSKIPYYTEKEKVDIINATATFPIGEGELTQQTEDGRSAYKCYNNSGVTSRLRLVLASAINPTGINTFIAKAYITDVSKVSSVTLSFVGISATISVTDLKQGWNELKFHVFRGDLSTWGNITTVVITATGASGLEWYLSELTYTKADAGWIIFIDDAGYSTFFDTGYDDLIGLNIPVTLAYDCGTPGKDAGSGRGHILTVAEVNENIEKGYLELSYHAWNSNNPSASMTAAEIRAETAKCLRMLQQNGWLPEHPWRAAHTQNSATNGLAQKGMVEALATWEGLGTAFNTFPFVDKWNISRCVLHGRTTTDLDSIFDVVQKTHCGMVFYTHGISTVSEYDVTPTIWNYFVGKLTTAVNGNWLVGVTYNELANGKWNDG